MAEEPDEIPPDESNPLPEEGNLASEEAGYEEVAPEEETKPAEEGEYESEEDVLAEEQEEYEEEASQELPPSPPKRSRCCSLVATARHYWTSGTWSLWPRFTAPSAARRCACARS